jgi:hypothetical protein
VRCRHVTSEKISRFVLGYVEKRVDEIIFRIVP